MLRACLLRSINTQLGHAIALRRIFADPIGLFRQAAEEQGPIARFQFGRRRFFLVNDPDTIQDCLVTNGAKFEKFPRVSPNHTLFGNGLLTSEEPLHMKQRRRIQPAFGAHRLEQFASRMIAAAQTTGRRWTGPTEIDVVDSMSGLALNVLTTTLFAAATPARAAELSGEMGTVLAGVNRLVMPWSELTLLLPLPSTVAYKRALQRVGELVDAYINDQRDDAPPELDFVGYLLHAAGADPMSARQMRDEAVTMFVAGHDTVAKAMAWTLYLLAAHPEIQQTAALSVDRVLGGKDPDAEHLAELDPVRHVFAESIRLFPPVWILGRRALAPYRRGGLSAAAGDVLLVSAAVLHRRAEFFTEPTQFRPERWAAPAWPRYAYLPFGAGLRLCIGERFAWMEGILCLSWLLQHFRFQLMEVTPPELAASLTLGPKKPIRLLVSPRRAVH